MLVLTFKEEDVVHLNDDITITIKKIGSGKIRLAFDAPDDIIIRRQALLDKEEAESI